MTTTITQAIVDKALRSRGERYDVTDARQPGLVLRVGKTGASWTVRCRVGGPVRKISIGSPPEISIAVARRIAAAVVGRAKAGLEPDFRWIEDERERQGLTVERAPAPPTSSRTTWMWGEARDRYLAEVRRIRSSGTVTDYRHTLTNPAVTAAFEGRLVAEIDKKAIAKVVRSIHDAGHERLAEKMLTILRPMWRFLADPARSEESGVEDNIVRLLEKPSRSKGSRLLTRTPSIEECARIIAVARSGVLAPTIAAAIELTVLTVQRRRTVVTMRISDLDLIDDPVWRIPAEGIKGGQEHVLPLTTHLLRLVREQRKRASAGYLFPGARPRTVGEPLSHLHESSLTHAMSGIPGTEASPHDIRRAFTTFVMTRPRSEVRQPKLVLDHREGRTDVTGEHYDRAEYLEEKGDMLIAWSAALEPEIERQAATLDVVEIRDQMREARRERQAKGQGKPRKRTRASQVARKRAEDDAATRAVLDDFDQEDGRGM